MCRERTQTHTDTNRGSNGVNCKMKQNEYNNNKKVLFNTNLTFDSNLYNDFTFSPFFIYLLRIYC